MSMLTINTIESAVEVMYEKSGGRVMEIDALLASLDGNVLKTNMYMRSTCLLRVTDSNSFTLYMNKEKAGSLYEILKGVGFLLLRAYDETVDAYEVGEYNVEVNGIYDREMMWAMDKFASLVMIEDEELANVIEEKITFGEVCTSFSLPVSSVLSRCQMMGYFLEMGIRV